MSRPRQSSALSNLIRQATASEVPDNTQPSHVTLPPERPLLPVPNAAPATAEELAEAFFPGSSIREHAFFPKSLTTHSQHSHYGFVGSFRREHWPHSEATQALAPSPPYNAGSARGSSAATGGCLVSAATSHSQHHLQRPSFIAEQDGEGDAGLNTSDAAADRQRRSGTGAAAGSANANAHHSVSRSSCDHALAPPAGESWSWHRWISPGMMATSPESWVPHGGGTPGQAHQQHDAQHHPHPHAQLAPSFPKSSFMLQPQLSRRRSLTREAGTGDQSSHHHHQPPARQHSHKEDADGAAWQGEANLTEPLLSHQHLSNKMDEESRGTVAAIPSTVGVTCADAVGTTVSAAAAAAAGTGASAVPRGLPVDTRGRSSFFSAVVFGIINAVVSMPTLIAYTAIVFKAPLYTPYIDSLCRFFFFSSGIHQLVFVALSTLPFAIGQVQDVGLIFLSAMASDIALQVTGPDAAAVALGSSLLAMTLSTFIVGLLTVFVARLKLADMVSYVPLPVVGGYLGFVGYFCIAGGTSLASGVQVDTLTSWTNLISWNPATKLLPTAGSIAALMLCVKYVNHPLALPGLLTIIPLTFHLVLWFVGWDLERAQQAGWAMPPTAGMSNCWQLWGLYNLQNGGLAHGVNLGAILSQLPKLAGLFLVVCFGSCMDVAAIQSDMPTPLDFNRELMTVGVSNMVTGALGAGYTGSYIFSQTVFTMRQGVSNRANGLVVAVVELLVFALPFSVVQYMPNFFFGALLVWFGVEISKDWLILSYRKLSRAEYVLLWATFVSIMNTGLELGIAAGIVMATLYFAFQYAQSQVSSLRQVAARSGRTHMYDTSSTLDLLGRRMAVLRLAGYVFFGSSTGLSNQVLQLAARMLQERAEESRQHEEWALSAEQRDVKEGDLNGRSDLLGSASAGAPVPVSASAPATVMAAAEPPPGLALIADGSAAAAAAAAAAGGVGGAAPGEAEEQLHLVAAPQPAQIRTPSGGDGGDGGISPSQRHWRAAAAISHAPIVLILDFGSVSGMDSTAARTFATLVSTLASQNVNVIFANLRRPDSRNLLEANGLPLRPYVLPPVRAPFISAATIAEGAGGAGGDGNGSGGEAGTGAGKLQQHVEQQQMAADSPLHRPYSGGCWEFTSAAAAVRCCEDAYLALAMAVGLLPAAPSQAASLQQLLTRNLREVFPSVPSDLGGLVAELEGALTRRQLMLGDVLYGAGAAVLEVYVIEFGALVEEEHYEGGVRVGSREHGAGVVVGALEFFLGRPAPATVRCSSAAACQLLCISRGAFARLMAHHPRALAALQVLLMRSACLDLASAQEAANHGAAA
ncbi:hypothetical protein Vafri_6858 [Volvox africanus]|uniref:STAS domain-containing protein n=1 Tax=Volvox africanus TaxID=51714 RepID=A0A8J4B029_9CHLO|nr:hypothetical protein Vafri_6858 [Volvox africanus]